MTLPKAVQIWLKKSPRPAYILADDKRVEIPSGRLGKALHETIESLSPKTLTAIDGNGTIIRSIPYDKDDDETEKSPEMSDVQLFAKLVAEAYDRGSKVNQPLIDNIVSFIDRQAQQIAKMSGEIDRLRNMNLKLQQQILELSNAPESDDGTGGLLGAVVQGIAFGEAQQQKGGEVTPIKKGGKP